VFGKAQSTGLVQTVKIRGLIEDQGKEKIVDSSDLFFVLPQVERNNEKEENKIEKTPIIVKDDGKDLKVLAPIRVSPVDSITLDSISYTENSSTELAGRARLANTVRIYLNNMLESEVGVNESGAWKASLSDIPSGVYTLRLDELDQNGSVEGRLELPFKREEEELIKSMGEGSITVQPGNSLWRIARKYYGKGVQYVEIFDRNSHLIKDPDLIYPGQVFSLPN
jgi:nucleoid-associated protein YgaU